METLAAYSLPKLLTVSLAISISTIDIQPANAQKSARLAEIGWESRLTSMGLDKATNIGKTYKFNCQEAPEDLIHAPLWGTNVYTANSGICSAAVHSGKIDASGGEIEVEILEGQEFYSGCKKNGLKSEDRAGTKLSYAFVGKSMAEKILVQEEEAESKDSSSIKKVMVNTVQRSVERSLEKVLIDLFD